MVMSGIVAEELTRRRPVSVVIGAQRSGRRGDRDHRGRGPRQRPKQSVRARWLGTTEVAVAAVAVVTVKSDAVVEQDLRDQRPVRFVAVPAGA